MNHIVEKAWLEEVSKGSFMNGYQPFDSMFFNSPQSTILALAPFADLISSNPGESLSNSARASLDYARQLGLADAVVMGAVGFDPHVQHRLRVCSQPLRQQQKDGVVLPEVGIEPAAVRRLNYVTQPGAFIDQVKIAKQRMKSGNLDKVVLSRALDVDFEQPPEISSLLARLLHKNGHGYTFAMPLDFSGATAQRRVLLGASPELLISKRGRRVTAFPLAGSEPRSAAPDVDRDTASKLLQSGKDRYEHDLVIRSIEKGLRRFCRWLNVPKEPSITSTETMWHLGTRIEGELLSPDTSSLELALSLHPTPAVGGYPTIPAKQVIDQIESYNRDFYAGAVGWCDVNGDGEWAVTIRCAQIQGRCVRLYAGAGIVAQSDPEKELAETSAKFRTMLKALNIHESC